MKITDVETIPINPRLAARHADQKPRFSGIDTQTIFKVTCDNGIVGYGDSRGHVSLAEATIQSLVGQTPFNYLMANLATGLMGALYDAMGWGRGRSVPARVDTAGLPRLECGLSDTQARCSLMANGARRAGPEGPKSACGTGRWPCSA